LTNDKEYSRTYYIEHREERLAYAKRYQQTEHRDDYLVYQKQRYKKSRHDALAKIQSINGSKLEEPVCAHCGLMNIEALTIDHINGRTDKVGGVRRAYSLYRWVLHNDFKPNTLQVLCFNCNGIKNRSHGNSKLPNYYEYAKNTLG